MQEVANKFIGKLKNYNSGDMDMGNTEGVFWGRERLGANKNRATRLFKVAWREWIESDVSQKIVVDKESGGASGEESACKCKRRKRRGFNP